MRSFQKLLSLSLVFLITINSSLAYNIPIPTEEGGNIPIPTTTASEEGGHISISPGSSLSPSPSPSPEPSLSGVTTGSAHLDAYLDQWCKSTDYPDLCVAAIAPHLADGKPDVFNALEIAIKSAVTTTKLAIDFGSKMKNAPLPSALSSKLKDALSSYDDALDNFDQAQAALTQRDWGTVNTMLSGALTSFGDCDDTLTGTEEFPTLTKYNDMLSKMTSNCLALSNILDPLPV